MTDGSATCPGCGDLVVVVAVKCLLCGEVLGTDYRAHNHDAPHASPRPHAVVYDVPAGDHRRAPQVAAPPAMRALPRPLTRAAPASFRMDMSFTARPAQTQVIQDMLDRGCASGLAPGTHVEVRNRFNERWTGGFVIDAALDDGYRLRRAWNGAVLPVTFKEGDLRPAELARR